MNTRGWKVTKPWHLAVAALTLGVTGYTLWHFCHDARHMTLSGQQPAAIHDKRTLSPTQKNTQLVSVEELLGGRCQRDGVALKVIATRKKLPHLPARFEAEAEGAWPKVIRKLEDRYSLVAVYDKDQSEPTHAPTRITQVGPYLYLGQDEAEIEALKMLADGTVEERSAALEQFGDDSEHAVSLFLALQQRDVDPQIRIEASRKLQSYPTDRVITGLVQTLGDDDDAVQAAARASLIWIGNEQVLRELRVATKNTNEKIADMATSILEENLERH
jgi:hypothetical protein